MEHDCPTSTMGLVSTVKLKRRYGQMNNPGTKDVTPSNSQYKVMTVKSTYVCTGVTRIPHYVIFRLMTSRKRCAYRSEFTAETPAESTHLGSGDNT